MPEFASLELGHDPAGNPMGGAVVATGFISGAVASRNLRGALTGAFSAGVFFRIGSHFHGVAAINRPGLNFVGKTGLTSTQFVNKTVAHGIAGGVMAVLQGGRFGHGFALAGVTQALSGRIDDLGRGSPRFSPVRITAAATLGGTVSELTSGKFANGAIT